MPSTITPRSERLTAASASADEERELAQSQSIKSVYVYEAPVRIWHWINALAITVLAVTGYFIPESVTPIAADLESHRIHLHKGRFPVLAPDLSFNA